MSLHRSTHVIGAIAMAAWLFLVLLTVAYATGVLKVKKPCTHGESSVIAYVGKDGKMHQSKPHVTGCVPP